MLPAVLIVDDDPLVLAAYRRGLAAEFDLRTAVSGAQALDLLEREGPFAVLVADMRMPGMTGLDLLVEVHQRWPDTVRIMLTGDSDQVTAMRAVNQGAVFRFLTKPCLSEDLALAVRAGARQHQLVQTERELLEKTLTGSVQVLSELLGLLDPSAFGRTAALRTTMQLLGRELRYPDPWHLEVAALLAPVGRVALPQEIRRKLQEGLPLDAAEARVVDRTGEAGAGLLARIPRLEPVAGIIRYQGKYYDGSGHPRDQVHGADLPLGARILTAARDYTDLEARRGSPAVALEALKLRACRYDPEVLSALERICLEPDPEEGEVVQCLLRELQVGMELASNLLTRAGHPVLPAGTRLGAAHLQMLGILSELLDLQDHVPVHPPTER